DLLRLLTPNVSEEVRRSHDWPQSAEACGRRLNRIVSDLRAVGVHLEKDKTHGGRKIRISMDAAGKAQFDAARASSPALDDDEAASHRESRIPSTTITGGEREARRFISV